MDYQKNLILRESLMVLQIGNMEKNMENLNHISIKNYIEKVRTKMENWTVSLKSMIMEKYVKDLNSKMVCGMEM